MEIGSKELLKEIKKDTGIKHAKQAKVRDFKNQKN